MQQYLELLMLSDQRPVAMYQQLRTVLLNPLERTVSFVLLSHILILGSILLLSSHVYADVRTHQYEVTFDEALHQASVKICFDGRPPDYLAVDYRKATKKLIGFPQVTKGHIEFEGRYWKTKNLTANVCINYQSDIADHRYTSLEAQSNIEAPVISFQNDNTWLWLPEKLSIDERAEIRFNLPHQYQISVPWMLLDPATRRYRIGSNPHDWGFSVVIGEFDFYPLVKRNGNKINLAIFPGIKQKEPLQNWILRISESLNSYTGDELFQQLQVILLENQRFKKGPVPWGDVKRGGGLGVRFVINSNRAIEDFYADWTATHEFSHLLVPGIEYQDIWLSEGLASYLQYVLMAQMGTLTEQEMWQRLYYGLKRGEVGAKKLSRETLTETAKKRRGSSRKARTMRIYWSGAALFLLADWELRKQSNGQQGLPDILLKLNRCCIAGPREWSGKALTDKLDELSQSKIFSRLFEQIAYSRGFPDYQSVFRALAIEIKKDDSIVLMKDSSNIRNKIILPTSKN